jgi:hypothetical protein
MTHPNGNGPQPVEMQMIPVTIVAPANVRRLQIDVKGSWEHFSGLRSITQPLQTINGIPDAMIVQLFLTMCNQGKVLKRLLVGTTDVLNDQGEKIGEEPIWETNEDGSVKLVPVASHFVVVDPPKDANAPPPSRIVVP